MIYMANSLLEGLENSNGLTPELSHRLQGEASFIRAFTYFYLVNLYGEVPLLLSTDYNKNQVAERTPMADIYEQIIEDLTLAEEFLETDYTERERTQVNSFVASALLARVYLYLEDWQNAAHYSSKVIEAPIYSLLEDLDQVFLANSNEAIWQISPSGGGSFTSPSSFLLKLSDDSSSEKPSSSACSSLI